MLTGPLGGHCWSSAFWVWIHPFFWQLVCECCLLRALRLPCMPVVGDVCLFISNAFVW